MEGKRPRLTAQFLKSMESAKSYNINELINDSIKPEQWKSHIENDLMKYWNMESAKTFQAGLYPTYRSNDGKLIPEDPKDWPEEFKAAFEDSVTRGLVEPVGVNYVRTHSRQTYVYGIAFHVTGKEEYLRLCRKGALALVEAMDGNYGMYKTRKIKTEEWDDDRNLRTSQDLAYGLIGLGMYYFLTKDPGMLHKIIQVKDYIWASYFDESKGLITWYTKNSENPDVEIVAHLDQLYAYMLEVTPALPEPYKSEWMEDIKNITDILVRRFYSERYKFFWGVDSNSESMTLGTDHTDFGHSVKAFWVILKVGNLIGDSFYIDFARRNIDKILKEAYMEDTKIWARRYKDDGTIDDDKEWWILAELDQACEILALNDPSYLTYLNNTLRYWLDIMVDHENGEVWHMVNGKTNKPVINYPKIHSWKNGAHTLEHALFSYMTSSAMIGEKFEVYYALPEWESISKNTVTPFMFQANIVNSKKYNHPSFMPDGNFIYSVEYDSLH